MFSIIFQLNASLSFAIIDNDIMDKSSKLYTFKGFDLLETGNNVESIDNKSLIQLFQNTLSGTQIDSEMIDNQFIVVLNDNENVNSLENPSHIMNSILEQNKDIDSTSFEIVSEFTTGFKGFTIKVFDNKVIDLLKENPDVKEIVPDVMIQNPGQSHLFSSENIYVDKQVIPTGIDRIDADLSSAKSGDGYGSVDIDIAVLDTGISLSHPDLNVYNDVSFVPGTNSGNDDNGHGTAGAGLAAAKDNDKGIVGVSPDARLWAVKVLDENNSGRLSWIMQGYEYVLQHADEIDVVNLSFMGPFIGIEQILIEEIFDAGIVMVASAGNHDLIAGGRGTPQTFPQTISTALMYDSDGECGGDGRPVASSGTFYGGTDDTSRQFLLPQVDIIAPGSDILSTYLGNSYFYFGGSSASAPIVSGAAALYLSNNPDATPDQVLEALQDEGSNQQIECDGEGHGYLVFKDDPRHRFIQELANGTEQKFPPLVYVGNF